MTKFIGIKFVNAEPMTASVAKEKGYRVENNNGEGYEVTYEDGYSVLPFGPGTFNKKSVTST